MIKKVDIASKERKYLEESLTPKVLKMNNQAVNKINNVDPDISGIHELNTLLKIVNKNQIS